MTNQQAFERVRYTDAYADFRHLATGRYITIMPLMFGALSVKVWREYGLEDHDVYFRGDALDPLVDLSIPEAAANDPDVLLAVPEALVTKIEVIAPLSPSEAVGVLFPDAQAVEDAERGDGMWRFPRPGWDGVWRLWTCGTDAGPRLGVKRRGSGQAVRLA